MQAHDDDRHPSDLREDMGVGTQHCADQRSASAEGDEDTRETQHEEQRCQQDTPTQAESICSCCDSSLTLVPAI